ncbi:hypothetical protein [Siphonobacter sp. SORGH_AS_1065]|uniref:hypothetical protein n=1 Tax=Siphonobacter sp. SORGH_AS_1065 TaxID=3041795 RepID=UPI002789F4D5|nr:hypothetical protein [Siphonobacter sp. SORGH_AS_1065]MDQ1085645.1 hypothetical protein [Siphonobacter sp. SORGH_AS_1065]
MEIQDFENNPALALLLERFVKYVENQLKSAAKAQEVELTGEMIDSIRSQAVEYGKGAISASVVFSELFRIKDMKQLRYTTVPPLKAMIDFVEKIGIKNFYVPGYGVGITPRTEHASVLRVARAIQFHFKSVPNVKRKYRGIYNDELKNDILPTYFEEMHAAAVQFSQQQAKAIIGKELFLATPDTRNWSRIMASTNSYAEGRIDTSKLKFNLPKFRQ